MENTCETCGNKDPLCANGFCHYVPMPAPASTVLTEEETESIYTKWCEDYEKNPDPTDEGSYLFVLLTVQDTHTRQLLPDELRAKGWKSPKETAVLMLRLYKAEQKIKRLEA